jgi:hypothetical protein
MALLSTNGTGGGNFNTTATWAGGVVPNGTTNGFQIVAGDVVTLDVDFTAGSGITGRIDSGGAMIVAGAKTLRFNDSSIFTGNGILDIQNGTFMTRDGCSFNQGATGAIYLASGCTWTAPNGASHFLYGSFYLNGGTVDIEDGQVELYGSGYLRSGTFGVGGSGMFLVRASGILDVTGGAVVIGWTSAMFGLKGAGAIRIKRRMSVGGIDATRAYGITGSPLRIGA